MLVAGISEKLRLERPKYFIRDHKYLIKVYLAFFIINLILIFFGYDSANLNGYVYSGSLIELGLNPYKFGNMAEAYFEVPYLYLISYAYHTFNYSIPATYVFVKIIGIFSYTVASFLIYDIISHKSKNYKAIFTLLLLNPFFFFYNDIQTVDTFFIIMLLVLGVWILQKDRWHNKTFALISGIFFILVSTFTLYFPILILPSLIVFRKKNKEKLLMIFILLTESAIMLIPIVLMHLSTSFPAYLFNPAPILIRRAAFFSIFWLIGGLTQNVYSSLDVLSALTVVIISLVIPVVMKLLKHSVMFSISLVLLLSFIITLNGVTPDLYIYLSIFLFISSADIENFRILKVTGYLITLSIIPLAIIQEFYWGLDGTTGIFYWLYPFLHLRIAFYSLLTQRQISDLIDFFLLLNTLIYGVIIAFIYKFGRTQIPRDTSVENRPTVIKKNKEAINSKTAVMSGGRFKFLTYLIALIIIIIIMVAPVGTNLQTGNGNGFPQFQFGINQQGNFVFQSNSTYEVISSNNSVYFPSSSNDVSFYRNLTGQQAYLNFNTSDVSTNTFGPGNSEFISTNLFNISYTTVVKIPANYSSLVPFSTDNVSFFRLSDENRSPYIESGTNLVNDLTGNGIIAFHLNSSSLQSKNIIFSEFVTHLAAIQTILWQLSIGNVLYMAVMENNSLYFSYYTDSWHVQTFQVNNIINNWNIVEISFSRNWLTCYFDGIESNMPIDLNKNANNAITFALGKFANASIYNYNYTFEGLITPIYLVTSNQYSLKTNIYVEATNQTNYDFNALKLNHFILLDTGNETLLSVNDRSLMIEGKLAYISFGKLGEYNTPMRFSFSKTYFFADSNSNVFFFKEMLVVTLLIPVLMGVLMLSNLKVKNK